MDSITTIYQSRPKAESIIVSPLHCRGDSKGTKYEKMQNKPNFIASVAIYQEASTKGDSKSVSLGLRLGSEVSTKPDVISKITIKNAKQTQFQPASDERRATSDE